MKEKKEFRLSYWAAHLTTIVSVTLVLLMIGIIALVTLGASRETRRLQERMELSVILADSISDSDALRVQRTIAAMPAAGSATLITRERAMEEWNQDTGENLEEVLGVNPFSPEVSMTVRAGYARPDSLAAVSQRLGKIAGVEEVAVPDAEMVETMNRNIAAMSWILSAIAAVMLVISFVLINNTVHLAIYSRRFTIHTMQLVGATDGFIRRPFLTDNLANGAVSGLAATILLAAVLWGVEQSGVTGLTRLVGWGTFAGISAALIITGGIICTLAAAIATRRYLHADYDELFK